MSLDYWLIIIVSVSLGYTYYSRVSKGIVKLDHFGYIMIGIILYWLLPIYAYEKNIHTPNYRELYSSMSHKNKESYLFFVLIIVTALLLGDWISKRLPYTFNIQNIYYSREVLKVFLIIFVFLGCYSGYFMRNAFFTGYESIGEWPHERGMFNSVCIALTTLNVINSVTHIIYKYSFISGKRILYLLVFNKYFILAFIFNILTLFTGNRGYFIAFIMSLLLIANEIGGGIRFKKFIVIMTIVIIFNSFVAIVRSTEDTRFLYNFDNYFGNFIYEFVNVSVTLNYHIKDMIYNLVEFPVVLISKFIGIIPSAIFPGKFAYMVSPDEVGKIIVPYQATTHNYVELLINFGLIGTIFIFFFIGIGFNWLKSKKHYTPIYIAICAQLPFFFFRSFYDATVKHIFEFSILLPLLILVISHLRRKYST